MPGSSYKCRVISTMWLSPHVVSVRFKPNRNFRYLPGQFISVHVPEKMGSPAVKRVYSLATSYEVAKMEGYELCVKVIPNGRGSQYVASLRAGDIFKISAPYGEFTYRTPEPGRSVCFISTGTGIAPIRSIVLSNEFQNNRPEQIFSLSGARTEKDILYPGLMESLGIDSVYAVSQPKGPYLGFTGRVTDVLNRLPAEWCWHTTDFYLCGNGSMLSEATQILHGGHGVPMQNIYKEAFTFTPPKKQTIQIADRSEETLSAIVKR